MGKENLGLQKLTPQWATAVKFFTFTKGGYWVRSLLFSAVLTWKKYGWACKECSEIRKSMSQLNKNLACIECHHRKRISISEQLTHELSLVIRTKYMFHAWGCLLQTSGFIIPTKFHKSKKLIFPILEQFPLTSLFP